MNEDVNLILIDFFQTYSHSPEVIFQRVPDQDSIPIDQSSQQILNLIQPQDILSLQILLSNSAVPKKPSLWQPT